MKGATPEATRAYASARALEGVAREHFREIEGLSISTLGLGTYLGQSDDETDRLYQQAIVRAAESGCNVVDTAINYRYQRSERTVGAAVRELQRRGIPRQQLFIASKAGFISYDGDSPEERRSYLERTFFSTGILERSDVIANCHAMTPPFLAHQLEQSLENLGLDTIDVYYLHNPETQLGAIPREQFVPRLRAAFELLERAASDGKISFYGTATWTAYRQPPEARDYLSLESMVSLARDIAGDDHRFRFVQLPYSLAMTEALTLQNQALGEETHSALQAASNLGLGVMTSASIGQGRLTRGLPDWLGKLMRGLASDVQRSIQFARSTPGVLTALVGMKDSAHVEENLEVARLPPAPLEDFLKLFEVDEGAG